MVLREERAHHLTISNSLSVRSTLFLRVYLEAVWFVLRNKQKKMLLKAEHYESSVAD